MSTTRRFTCDDLFRFSPTNLDILTETYSSDFYWKYMSNWPDMMIIQEVPNGRVSSYMIGKAEGEGNEWHGHISAVTVAPEFRRLGLARTLCNDIERSSDEVYNGYFIDLFVRVSNIVAIQMYLELGYVVYRRVLQYYGGVDGEDAFDMRKPLSRDPTGLQCIPLPAPITVRELFATL